MRYMERVIFLVVLFLLVTMTTGGLTKSKKHQQGGKKTLSDKEHYEGGQHKSEYDHEAFLGDKLAKTFSDLSSEEAMRRLGVIVDKIDTNSDGQITEEELTNWVRLVSRRSIYDDRDLHWDYHVKDGSQYMSWDEYENKGYGSVKDRNQIYDQHRNLTFHEAIARFKRRYDVADRDGDGLLNKEEFTDFLTPYDVPMMRHLVVDENFQDMDQNRDGQISVDEYLDNLGHSNTDPNWKERELEYFTTLRDLNKDGYLNKKELEAWLYPPGSDPWVNEAKHLIHHADLNQDKMLSNAEILNQMDLFVGSHATEHGKFFVRHDEF